MNAKDLLRVFVIVAMVAPILVPLTGAWAATGCCLKHDKGQWEEISTDFELCDRLNRDDGDDIFEPTGLFWWSIDC